MTDAKTHKATRAAASTLVLLRTMVEEISHETGGGMEEAGWGRRQDVCTMRVEGGRRRKREASEEVRPPGASAKKVIIFWRVSTAATNYLPLGKSLYVS